MERDDIKDMARSMNQALVEQLPEDNGLQADFAQAMYDRADAELDDLNEGARGTHEDEYDTQQERF